MTWARAAALNNYIELVRRIGLDPEPLLARAGIDPGRLRDPDERLPASAVAELFEWAAQEGSCPNFGVLLAESRQLSWLGPLSLLLQHQETLGATLEAFVRYEHLLTGALSLALEPGNESTILRVQLVTNAVHPPRQAMDFLMATLARTLGELGGEGWRPECVHFMRQAPPDLAAHRRAFGCEMQFGSDFNGMVFANATLERVSDAARTSMARYAKSYLEAILPGPDAITTTERVHRAIYLLLPSGAATIELVAKHLIVGPRTLQRSLEREHQTFSSVLNIARRELATRCLVDDVHSMHSIATLLGYSTQSSFTRWFTAEFGMSPSAWKKCEIMRIPGS